MTDRVTVTVDDGPATVITASVQGPMGPTGATGAQGPASASDSNLLESGEGTLPRINVRDSTLALTSGTLRLSYFTARRTETVVSARVFSGGTAAGATPTLVRVGIYSVAVNGDLTLIASTPNDTTLLAAQNTAYTKAFSVPWSKVAGTRYALAILVVTGAAAPTTLGTFAAIATEAGLAPRLAAAVSGQSDLPASIAAGSLANSTNMVYGAVVP